MNKMFCLMVIFLTASCFSKYENYHADWILVEFTEGGQDIINTVGMYNFKIDKHTKKATPIGIYVDDDKFMTRKVVDFEFSTENKVDYIKFINHPFFKKRYMIECQDENCCSIKIYDKSTSLRMKYNSDIPYGKNRECN